MRVGVAAAVLAALVGLLPPAAAAQTAAEYYWWKALERGEDLRSAARYTSDPEFAFVVTSTLLDVDTGLALAEYARSLRRAKRTHEAVVVEQRAALFLQAKFGSARDESAVHLGFRPTELLKEYASDLRQLGRTDEAARIDSMAERYQQVQLERVRRLQERPR